jgi:IS30 family transposase
VLQERVSRYFFAVKLPCCTKEEATKAIIRLLKPLGPQVVRSLTCDNGSEFYGHQEVSEALNITVYFCHPYCSSERGGVENRNGALRRFYPKKTNFDDVSDDELEQTRQTLINRPMQCLGAYTPQEFFSGEFKPMIKLAA